MSKGYSFQVAKLKRLENLSLWQKISSVRVLSYFDSWNTILPFLCNISEDKINLFQNTELIVKFVNLKVPG